MSSNPLEEIFASTPDDLAGTEPDENSTGNQQQLTAIGPFLRDLREAAPCVSSNTRLASLTHTCRTSNAAANVQARRSCPAWPRTTTYRCKTFLEVAGVLKKENAGHELSAADIRRSFRFVLDDRACSATKTHRGRANRSPTICGTTLRAFHRETTTLTGDSTMTILEMPLDAVGYGRVSTGGQDEALSVDTQAAKMDDKPRKRAFKSSSYSERPVPERLSGKDSHFRP